MAAVEHGFSLAYDVSLPSKDFYRLVELTRERVKESSFPLKDEVLVTGFGHVGDGNLHICVTLAGYDKE